MLCLETSRSKLADDGPSSRKNGYRYDDSHFLSNHPFFNQPAVAYSRLFNLNSWNTFIKLVNKAEINATSWRAIGGTEWEVRHLFLTLALDDTQRHAPVALRPGTRIGAYWRVVSKTRLDGCGKFRLHQGSNPSTVQPVGRRYTGWDILVLHLVNSSYVLFSFTIWISW